MDKAALYKINYGLYVVSVREGDRDNACIGNVFAQVSSDPLRVSLALNKQNLTCWMLDRTGVFNVSILTKDAPFDVFKRFGYQSGTDVDKFAGTTVARSENGVSYQTEFANAFVSGKVVSKVDLGSHILFIAEVTDAKVLSDAESISYDDYQKNVKPKRPAKAKGWRCKVCGYVHESDELPSDFVCPICKHGADDFEKIA